LIHTAFYFVLNMSITAVVIGVIILIVRTILGKWLTKFAAYCLWFLVLFRTVIPFSFGSEWSFINTMRNINMYTVKTVNIQLPVIDSPHLSMLNTLQRAESYYPVVLKSSIISDRFIKLSWIWFFGVVISVLSVSVLYYLAHIPFQGANPINVGNVFESCTKKLKIKDRLQVFCSDIIATPMVVGILSPRIIIPKNIEDSDVEHILMHELVHVKRRDNLWRMVGILAACLHWFNPFAWLFVYISSKDAELACDERVLRTMDYSKRKDYAKALAKLAVKQNTPEVAFGGIAVRQRILNVLNYKRVPIMVAVVSALFCIAFAFILLSNPI
jgi:beta-lactamase regulating signal transducer with metallopeptidase domain